MSTSAGCEPGQSPQALKGVRVLELGSLIAGPYASALLAQFGAEVIKVEPPGQGDPLRKWRKLHAGTSLWWYVQSRNKKSIALDLKTEAGREATRRLAAEVHVVVENFRPGTLEGWGLGWNVLKSINPKLVMLRVSGYGQSGPRRDLPGFASIAECMGGLRYVTGAVDRPPARCGISLGDTLASLYGVFGVMVALHHVNTNAGPGQCVDLALYEAVFATMESLVPEFAVQGFVRERSGASLPGIAPSNTYACAEGAHVAIAANGDSLFRRLMSAIGREELGEDPQLADNEGRVRRAGELDTAIGAWTAMRTVAEVIQILEAAAVPVGKIYTAADICADPHYAARGMIEQHVLPDGQAISVPGVVPKLTETPGRTRWLGPALGEHNREVLGALGAGPLD
jgi:crotonobetainyl-CoA:carnitine CoA-transferase CaiB-like acyl-CoA transferase